LRNNRIPQGYGFGRFGFPAGQQLSHAVCTMISFDSRSNGEPVHECPREKKFVTPDLIAVAPGLSDGVARGRRYRPNVGRGLSGGGSGRDRLLAGGVRKRPWPTSFSDVRRAGSFSNIGWKRNLRSLGFSSTRDLSRPQKGAPRQPEHLQTARAR